MKKVSHVLKHLMFTELLSIEGQKLQLITFVHKTTDKVEK